LDPRELRPLPPRRASRRRFLGLLAVGSATLGLSVACQSSTPSPTPAPKAESKPAGSAPAAPAPAPAAPAAASPAAQAAPAAGAAPAGSLKMGQATIPDTLDPHQSTNGTYMPAYYALFDTLTLKDEKGQLKPALAESWRSVDPTTWEFKLRSGVTFQNGEPSNAEAVKFSLDRVLKPGDTKGGLASFIPLVAEIRAVDPATVQIVTKSPDPLVPTNMAIMHMIPPKYFQEVGPEQFATRPVGTGPWKLKEFAKDQRIVLEAWPQSWRGAPKLAEVRLLAMLEGSTRVAALQTGEIDVAQALPNDLVDQVKRAGADIAQNWLGRAHIVVLDMTKPGPVQNQKVRQALNYAVDKQGIVKSLLGSYARESDGQLVGQDAVGYNPALKPIPYDVNRAKQLLAEAGFPNGFEVGMGSPVGGYYQDKDTAEAITGFLEAVGVKAKLTVREYATHIKMRSEGTLEPLYFHGFNYFPQMDADRIMGWFLSAKQPGRTPTYNNPTFDDLLNKSRTELDPAKREKLLQQAAQVMYDDPAVIFLFQPPELYGVGKKVKSFVARADAIVWFDSISREA
jgi:peptide/nickel transport system substrate-binding protein